eukprot:TRINITY_DN1230_c0_g2_i1.p1 TRINITY_DN1230_c0_g2~~TRINITY_DN1230_c0_g2_i1.p1  ORF type:complete len:197 (+),score=52.13 TRINITY_DN1230_c0_g2_i1:90-680(+)
MLITRVAAAFRLPIRSYFKKDKKLKNLLKHLELPKNPENKEEEVPAKAIKVQKEPKKDPRRLVKTYQREEVVKSEVEKYVESILSPKMTVTYFQDLAKRKVEPLPVVPQLEPYEFKELIPNKTYFWCGCGISTKQPFCEGKHHESIFKAVSFKVDETNNKNVKLCGCKQSSKKPYCDNDTCVKLRALEEAKKKLTK